MRGGAGYVRDSVVRLAGGGAGPESGSGGLVVSIDVGVGAVVLEVAVVGNSGGRALSE